MCNGFFRTDIFDFPENEINDISPVSENLLKASIKKQTQDYLNQKYGDWMKRMFSVLTSTCDEHRFLLGELRLSDDVDGRLCGIDDCNNDATVTGYVTFERVD